jgi:hypothetical protein
MLTQIYKTEPMLLFRHAGVHVVEIAGKGRGLIAAQTLEEDELLEAAPVIPLKGQERTAKDHPLHDYVFQWPNPPFVEAVALGIISLANHSKEANGWFMPDIGAKVIRLYAQRHIEAGEEITIDYGIPLWFEAQP